jgi:hypothetical protein
MAATSGKFKKMTDLGYNSGSFSAVETLQIKPSHAMYLWISNKF